MIGVMLGRFFEHPYIPKALSFGSDSLLRKLRLSEDGYATTTVLRKLIGNVFVFPDDIEPGDILEAVSVTINTSGEKLIGYCAVLSIADNNIVLSENCSSKNEAQIAYTIAIRMNTPE